MSTATALIDEALKILRVKSPDVNTPTAEYDDALIRLNDLMESWATDIETLGVSTLVSVTPTGANPITIGPTGDTATTRPIDIRAVTWHLLSHRRHPLELVPWAKLQEYSTRAFSDRIAPVVACYRPARTNGELWVLPIPSAGALTVQAVTPIYTWAALSTDVALPPALKRAIELNLAVELAGQYQIDAGDETKALAADAKAAWAAVAEAA